MTGGGRHRAHQQRRARPMPATSPPGRWLDRHIAVLVVALVTGAGVTALLVVGWVRMEAWQRGLLTTGRRTTGTVVSADIGVGRTPTLSITLAVAADPPFDVTMDVGSFDRYAVGRAVDVWYDPGDTGRARTRWDSSSDGSAEILLLGSMAYGWGAFTAVARIGRLRSVRVRVGARGLTAATVRHVGTERRSRRRDLARVMVSDRPNAVYVCSKRAARRLAASADVTVSPGADVRLVWSEGRGTLIRRSHRA